MCWKGWSSGYVGETQSSFVKGLCVRDAEGRALKSEPSPCRQVWHGSGTTPTRRPCADPRCGARLLDRREVGEDGSPARRSAPLLAEPTRGLPGRARQSRLPWRFALRTSSCSPGVAAKSLAAAIMKTMYAYHIRSSTSSRSHSSSGAWGASAACTVAAGRARAGRSSPACTWDRPLVFPSSANGSWPEASASSPRLHPGERSLKTS